MNNCGPEKDRYWKIRDVNNRGPEKDRYLGTRAVNHCVPDKDRYRHLPYVNNCGPENNRYWQIRGVNKCGPEKDRYLGIRTVNHCGPEKDRYQHIPYVNNCCPEKDRYWYIRDVNNCCPEKDRYWWNIPYVNNRVIPEKGRYNEPYHLYGECVDSIHGSSIIFLSAGTRRVFPVEIFLNRDVAPVSAICMVSSTSSICSSFPWRIACSLPTGGSCLAMVLKGTDLLT